jgi:type VI protein secretion system component VasK
VRFPVYLVFTHMDEVEGFTEFFAAFDQNERAQGVGRDRAVGANAERSSEFR